MIVHSVIFILYFYLTLFTCAENDALHDQDKLINKVSEGEGWVSGGCQVADAGVIVRHGENWWSDDRCTECHCKNGVLECQNSHCASCINPHYLPGQCCPVCNEKDIHLPHCKWIDGCNLKCKHGLKRDNEGCFQCECRKVEGEECPLQCPGDKYMKDALGVTLCECANQTSVSPSPTPTSSQPSTCLDEDMLRMDGKEWSDGCRHCTCSHGVIMCSLLACPRCPGASVMVPGECCPRCNGSASEEAGVGSSACQSSDGAVRQLGARWRLEAACAECECRRGGEVLCGAEPCPPAACSNPVAVSGECCPRCMTMPHRPSVHDVMRPCPSTRVEGETWRQDECSSCRCLKGQAVCFEETCQPPACAFPLIIKGRCCPVCQNVTSEPAVCISNNTTYSVGDEWWKSACVKCTCREEGRVTCSPPPPCSVHCEHPVLQPGHCCPTCPEEAGARAVECAVHYQTATFVLATLLVLIILGGICWVTKRWQRGSMIPTGCCARAAKVRSCKNNGAPAYAAYNPVKHCESDQPNAEQRSSFVRV